MSKYFSIMSTYFRVQLAWKFDIWFSSIFSIVRVLFAVILWSSILATKGELKDFTYESMMTYYLIIIFFSNLDMSGTVSNDISESVKKGTFSKYMVLPIRIFPFYIFKTIGTVLFRSIFYLLAVFVWGGLFRISFKVTSNPVLIFSAIFILLLGLFFMIQLNYFLGLLAFKYIDIGIFLMIKTNFVNLVNGAIIPLALFPESILQIFRFLPFYSVAYLPTMLMLGRNASEILFSVGVLIFWISFFTVINYITYKKMVLNYDGVGL